MPSAGGGGYGDPLERDPEKVRADLEAGYISPERGSERYGVVLDADGGVDEATTRASRRAIAERRHGIPFHEDEADCYEGFRGRHRVLRLPAGLAAGLGVAEGGLVELLGRHPAPLRAWVRIVEGGPEGSLPLDAFARRVLGLVGGDEVVLRPLSMPVIPGDMTGFA